MKKHIIILASALLSIQLIAQPTDRPLNNFYASQDGNRILHYEKVYTDSLDNTKTIVRKLSHYLLTADGVSDVHFDSSGIFTGKLKNIHPKYYNNGNGKELTGDFTIEIKDGKYKVTVHDMVWQSGEVAVYGIYGYGGSGKETLESTTLNNKGTKWQSVAFHVLPDIDDLFVKKFTLPAANASSW